MRTGESAPAIDFDHVWFRYPTAAEVSLASLESIALPVPERTDANTDVLRDISFHAPAGKLTALVGPSGAGKTTITQLVARLYDPRSGTITIDGSDITGVTQESLHDAIGVVTQDAHMFHDTIRANLSYAKPGATEAELIEACKAAQIWPLIETLPDGLDTIVGDRGYRLSGGEKQRIALARLLLKAPSVVVLDEATAHLDSESEAAVQRALKTALAGRTSLVIAHRLSTIIQADQILVIDGGKVTERGTHANCSPPAGCTRELYHTQFASQDVAPARDLDAETVRSGPGSRLLARPAQPAWAQMRRTRLRWPRSMPVMRIRISTMIAPMIEPMMPTVWKLAGATLWYSIRFQMNPPTKDPTMPSRIVPKKPIESRPGTSSRATAPAMSPTIIRMMM